MNKFAQNLAATNKEIKAKRAENLAIQASLSQESLVKDLRKERTNLEAKMMNLEDLSPDSTTSLKVGGADFDAESWVNEVQEVKIALMENKIRLQCAEETMDEYFTETKED